MSINIEDLIINKFGMDVRIKETKTKDDDLVKEVVYTGNEYCPINAVKDWIEAAISLPELYSDPLTVTEILGTV